MKKNVIKKILFSLFLSLIICLSTNVYAEVKVGDIVKNGDVLGAENGTELVFYRNNEIISDIVNLGPITFGTLPNNIWGNSSSLPSDYFENIENISIYWKVVSIHNGTYGGWPCYELIPFNYTKPTFEIECNPIQVSPGQVSNCSLYVNYQKRINNISFKLNTDKFDIKDEMVGELFENLKLEDSTYSLIAKDSMQDNENVTKVVVLNFSLSLKDGEKAIDDNNINVTSISYDDALSSHDVNDQISTTVKSEVTSTDNQNDIENPKTNNSLYYILLFVGIIMFFSLVILKYKNKKEQ